MDKFFILKLKKDFSFILNKKTSKMEVEIFIKVDKSKVPAYQTFADDRGDEISIFKFMKFDDVGLLLMENGEFQCLACSTILPGRQIAVNHFKHFHSNSADCMIKCPMCYQDILKSALNCHMNQKHGIDNIFFKVFKRSFLPDASEVEIFIKVNESKVPEYQKFAENHGDEISISKPIKFDDVGLLLVENGQFQCLACSKILAKKQRALSHYKKYHSSCINQLDSIIQCPRSGCSQWILKSVFNCHMNQKHEIDNIFFKVFKRSVLPDASENPAKKEKV